MGLDLYIYSTKHHDSNPAYVDCQEVDAKGNPKSYPFLKWLPDAEVYSSSESDDGLYEEAYWRKNWFICDFFNARYHEAVLEDKGDEYNAEDVNFNCSYLKLTPKMVVDCMDAIKDCSEEQWEEESWGQTKFDCLKMLSTIHLKMVYGDCPLDFYVMPWW